MLPITYTLHIVLKWMSLTLISLSFTKLLDHTALGNTDKYCTGILVITYSTVLMYKTMLEFTTKCAVRYSSVMGVGRLIMMEMN